MAADLIHPDTRTHGGARTLSDPTVIISRSIAGVLESEVGKVAAGEGAEGRYRGADHGKVHLDDGPEPDVVAVP